jgi:hypothetical protein
VCVQEKAKQRVGIGLTHNWGVALQVHHILAELVQGGLVLETNVEEIARAGTSSCSLYWSFSSLFRRALGERLTVHGTWCAAPPGLTITATRTIILNLQLRVYGWD